MKRLPIGRKPAGSALGNWCNRAGNRPTWRRLWARGAVSQWVSKARQGGVAALRRRQHPGGQSKLDDRQRERLPELLAQGPAAYGFSGEVWTRSRVVRVIEQEFGVSYDPSQVGRILRSCGWSQQKPALRSTQRDEDAIEDWRERRFAELKKTP